ncbi:MAG: hypothetical protein AAB339_04945, partial [Elusimicrobiota bacterium]
MRRFGISSESQRLTPNIAAALLLLVPAGPRARAQDAASKDPAEIRLEELRTRMRVVMNEIDPAASNLASMI